MSEQEFDGGERDRRAADVFHDLGEPKQEPLGVEFTVQVPETPAEAFIAERGEREEAAAGAPPFDETVVARSLIRLLHFRDQYCDNGRSQAATIAECITTSGTPQNVRESLEKTLRFSAEERLKILVECTPEQSRRLARQAVQLFAEEERLMLESGTYPGDLVTEFTKVRQLRGGS